MATREFVRACKSERDALLALYYNAGAGTAVGAHLAAAELTPQQRTQILAALDCAMTDAFYTLLLGLAGVASLGGSQQEYRLADARSRPISPDGDDDLESLAFELFQAKS